MIGKTFRFHLLSWAFAGLIVFPINAHAKCESVRLADIGWTDVSATTAIAAALLSESGYDAKVLLLSLPVTLASLKNNDIDIYMGNWMPTQEADVRTFLNEGSVKVLTENLAGAKYTLAVPKYLYDQGLKTFSDIHKFSEALGKRIYGIEPGNDGNRNILKMIEKNDFDLKDFQLIESSEQAMLMATRLAIEHQEAIVFLGWAPHPMNSNLELEYLSGGDNYFGENLGSASVFTLSRKDFAAECPQLATFFSHLKFTVDQENELMKLILDDSLSPAQAAKKWLAANPQQKSKWLEHLDRNTMAQNAATLRNTRRGSNFSIYKLSNQANDLIINLTEDIAAIHPAAFIFIFSLIVFLFHRKIWLALGISAGFSTILLIGLWEQTIQTLALVFLSTAFCAAFGIPLGIWSARRPQLDRFINPFLDMMQTVPTFVYLIPTLLLFGLGVVPGLISTVIFAIAAPIRLTRLGIRSVPAEMLEVGDAFGATKWQKLLRIELPSARLLLLEGISQCVMLSLSMAVIAALVGAQGLGAPIIRALNTVNLSMGAQAGAAIVILAAILDRSLRRSQSAHS